MSFLWKSFGLIFLAELGDKTQFLMIAMARRYALRTVLAGVCTAILLLNGMAVGLGVAFSGMLPRALIGTVSGVAFLLFAYRSVGDSERESADLQKEGRNGGFATVFGTFFLAELGDKTQLTVFALATALEQGADRGKAMLFLLFGASFALFLADFLGFLVGFCMKKALPDAVFSRISVSIFAIFGIVKLLDGLEESLAFLPRGRELAIVGTFAASALLVAASIRKVRKSPHRP